MRTATILATLALAATSAFAQPTAENTDPVARALPACQPPSSATGIIRPKTNATITTGKPFLFSFCSPTYFKTSSKEILVGFEDPFGNGGDGANLIAVNLTPGQYTQNLTVYSSEVGTGKRNLAVYEVQNGYYNRYNYVKFVKPVTIVQGSS
ncbi:hypothetical protein OC834_004435 [Tilletia horrida]|nr:hypothetical protein OC834_004435 [Tilletia horrida]